MTLKKKVFILNDTRSDLHHGSSRVMNNLEYLIKANGAEVVGFCPVGKDWRKDEDIKRRIALSDMVLVNGEGSIHHNSRAGIPLLSAAQFAKQYGVQSFLVNALYQDMHPAPIDQLRAFDKISVRDSYSQKQLQELGISSTLLPDLTFFSDPVALDQRNGNMYTCSVAYEKTVDLYRLSKKDPLGFFEPIVFGRGDWSRNVGTESLIQKYSQLGMRRFCEKAKSRIRYFFKARNVQFFSGIYTHDHYHRLIASSKFLVSGRFHGVCFAINSFTPFVCVKSNSFKLQALIDDFGLSKYRIVDDVNDLGKDRFFPYSTNEMTAIKERLSAFKEDFFRFYAEILS